MRTPRGRVGGEVRGDGVGDRPVEVKAADQEGPAVGAREGGVEGGGVEAGGGDGSPA